MCSQSVETTGEREVSCTVPVEQLPDIMRAVGYYPSEEQVRLAILCLCVLCACVYCVPVCLGVLCVLCACVYCVQIENMVNEVKFSNYVSSKVFKTQIDLGDTLKRK